jgi:predicted nucleic acid-binding protein
MDIFLDTSFIISLLIETEKTEDDTKDLKLIENVARTCRLMPNDAVIAATCKFYDIKKLATFDDDFNRVDFLEIVKAE